MADLQNEARALFLQGMRAADIAVKLDLEAEVIEAWRDGDCWEAARQLAKASEELKPKTRAQKTDEIHSWILNALFTVSAKLTKVLHDQSPEAMGSDVKAWGRSTGHLAKALSLREKIETDLRQSGARDRAASMGDFAAVAPWLRSNTRTTSGPHQGESSALRPGQVGPSHDNDPQAIIVSGLSMGLVSFAKALARGIPSKPAAHAALAGEVRSTLENLLQVRIAMRAIRHRLRVESAAACHADHDA